MTDTKTMTETGPGEMGPKQMRIEEAGANQETTDKDTMISTPGTDQGIITDQHTTEIVAETGEILGQGKEK